MDLDALAGVIAYKHTGDFVTTVTAAVDRITISHPLEEICDLELSGQVTFATGRSSMEVSLQVAKASETGGILQERGCFDEVCLYHGEPLWSVLYGVAEVFAG